MVDHTQPSTIHFSTLPEFLRWRALHQPDRVIFTWLNYLDNDDIFETTLNYKEIDKKARHIGACLQAHGAKGERALLLYPPGLDYILAFFGCLYAGVIAVPAYPPFTGRLLKRLQTIVSDSESRFVLTTSGAKSFMAPQLEKDIQLQHLTWIETDTLETDMENQYKEINIDEGSIAFLQYTSGSTSDPKGPMITHSSLLHNLESMHQYFVGTTDNVGVSWLPQYHDMGLVGCILASLFSDVPVVSLSPLDFLQKPFRWLEAISRYRGTISGAPNFAYNLCISKITDHQRQSLDLSCWDIAGNAAEPVRADTIENFSKAFESCGFRKQAFKPGYGLAESTFMATKVDRGIPPTIKRFKQNELSRNQVVDAPDGDDTAMALVGCGKILHQGKIVIVDPDSLKECPSDAVGEIWISSPSVARGYWNRPDETMQTFGASLSDTGTGPFLRTGDLGFLKDEELFLTGRIKDLIIIHGRNHYPQDIERTVEESHAALRPGCTAVFSLDIQNEEKLTVVQEIKKKYTNADTDFNDIFTAICRSILEEHALDVYDILLIKAGNIPKTSSGKIQRRACRNDYLKNELKVIGHYRGGFKKAPAGGVDPGISETVEVRQIRAWLISTLTQKVKNPDFSTPEQILEKTIRKILSALLKLDPNEMKSDIRLDEYGMNSLQMMEMDDLLQHLFGIGLSSEEWKKERTIRTLTQMLLSKPRVLKAIEKRRLPSSKSLSPQLTMENQIDIPPLLDTRELLLLDFFNWAAKFFWRLDVKGLEHLTLKKPFIICPNHESHLDSFVVASSLPWALKRNLCTFAAREVFEHYFHKRFSKIIRSIPTDRYGDQRPVLKTGEKLIRAGRHLLIFPEGRRTRDKNMNDFQGGAAYLSRKTGAPIIPVFIKGTGSIYPPEKKWLPHIIHPYLRKEQIKLVFGSPIKTDGGSNAALTQKIYQNILNLKAGSAP